MGIWSPVPTNLVLEDVGQRVFIQPLSWQRCIDNVISVESVNEVECLLSHLNSVKPAVQFTFNVKTKYVFPYSVISCIHFKPEYH